MIHNILIVDDSATTRAMIRRTIQLAGIEVDCMPEASDGKEALAVASAGGVDLILADLNMPGMNGFEMTWRLSREPATRDIPVVLVSAEPNAVEFAETSSNVRACIRKPFTPESIRNVINEVLGATHA